MKKLFENCKILLMFVVVKLLYVLCLKLLGISCPIKEVTGISCPGCGMTRACVSALQFKFDKAFYYHPIIFVLPFFVIVLFVLKYQEKKKAFKITFGILIGLFIVVYICRMIWSDGVVVVFEPQNGQIARLINKIRK